MVTARWVETAPGQAVEPRRTGSSRRPRARSRAGRPRRRAPRRGASASSSGLFDRQRDGGSCSRPRPAAPPWASATTSLADQVERVPHLLGLPPAVDQGRDRARLDRRHVGHDPGRAVAHRDRDAVALGDFQLPARIRASLVACVSSSAKFSRSSPATTPRPRRAGSRRRRT